jgi:hypothetical protein
MKGQIQSPSPDFLLFFPTSLWLGDKNGAQATCEGRSPPDISMESLREGEGGAVTHLLNGASWCTRVGGIFTSAKNLIEVI